MPFFPFTAVPGPQIWLPSDNGLLLSSGDPDGPQAAFTPTAGTLYLTKLTARSPVTISNLWYGVQALGVGASTGSFIGAISSTGTLLSGSSDIGASLVAGPTGPLPFGLTTPQALVTGQSVWSAFLCNLATTQPGLYRHGGGPAISNVNLTAAQWRFAINGSGLVALPGSITPSANATPNGGQLWVGAT